MDLSSRPGLREPEPVDRLQQQWRLNLVLVLPEFPPLVLVLLLGLAVSMLAVEDHPGGRSAVSVVYLTLVGPRSGWSRHPGSG